MASIEDLDTLARAIAQCGDEPIHIPGSIQPHGFLLVLSEPQLTITQASENVREWLGVDVQTLLGQPLTELIGECGFAEGLASLADDDHNPFHLRDINFNLPGRSNHPPFV